MGKRAKEVFEVSFEDRQRIEVVRNEVLRLIKKLGQTPEEFFGDVIRSAEDEVFSMGLMRYSVEQLDTQEKIYIGKRVEILTRDRLDVGKGTHSDALIGGVETDFKYSMKCAWMIGPETIGTVCLGIGLARNGTFKVGFFVPYPDRLRPGTNRDAKLSLKASFRDQCVQWLITGAPVPPNFFATIAKEVRDDILAQSSAQARVKRLAELLPNRPIPRSVIVFVSLGKDDPLRRIRADKRLRSPPLGKMVRLSKYNKAVLKKLNVTLGKDEFYFIDQAALPVD
jgi:hypothetical protein